MLLVRGDDPKGHVGRGADVQRDGPLAKLVHEGWIFQAPDAVADPLRPERAEGAPDALGAGSLAGMGTECSPAAIASAKMSA